jgi:hypothetical protein
MILRSLSSNDVAFNSMVHLVAVVVVAAAAAAAAAARHLYRLDVIGE